jgi:N-acetylglucosaminylphosphatidylinositol deacetylase
MSEAISFLVDILDFGEGLDFWTKYGLIISNFIIIGILVIKTWNKNIIDVNKKNILFVTAHPDDEAMFFLPTIY